MNNVPARAFSEKHLTETSSDSPRQPERQTSDAGIGEKAYASSIQPEQSNQRTAERWWLRKRVMGFSITA